MKRTQITPNLQDFPSQFHLLLTDAAVFDSSCSPQARVWFVDKDGGFYLKRSAMGTLKKEAAMTRFFHEKGLAAEVLAYERLEDDWLLTRRVPGEDCLDELYLSDPKRLCDTTAELLRRLHELPTHGCPINRTADYIAAARRNFEAKAYDMALFPDNWGYDTPEAAFRVVEENARYLKTDTLLHGDYCLPNILLDNWAFSGFIDLDAGGIGDRHIDLFWGVWSLQFNLKTDRYRDRFLDAYGRDKVNEDCFPIISAFEVFG